MKLLELGHMWPCQTEGTLVNLEETEPHAGDVLECYFSSDIDITSDIAGRIIWETVKIKENYPSTVIHYINIEPRRITIQYSIAPVGGHASPFTWWQLVILLVLAIAGIILVHAELTGRLFKVPPPSGQLSVSAVGCSDEQCTSPEALDVTFSVAGKTYSTNGGTVLIELPVGTYDIIPGLPPEGYQPADPVTITIAKDQTISIRLKYYEIGVIPLDFAWLVIDTSPVKGPVYVNEQEIGKAPVEVEVFPLVTYVVSFGDVSGYDTPPSQTHSLQRGETRGVDGKYEKVGWPEWAKWTAIGGGTAVGIIVVVKTVELILSRR